MYPIPEDGRLRVVSRNESSISFAAVADGDLPPLPAPSGLELRRGNEVVASGHFGNLCSSPAFVVEEVP